MNAEEDQTLFKNRLRSLMREKGIDPDKKSASTKLAKKLLDQNLVTVNQDPSDDLPEIVKNRAIDSTRKKIDKHLDADDADKLQGEFAYAYCIFFGCSADYLFGIIPDKTHQITDISNYTGLSESSIEKIHEFNIHKPIYEGYIDSLNTILESRNLDSILDRIKSYHKALDDLKISSDEWDIVKNQIPAYIIQSVSNSGDKPEYLDTQKAENKYDQARDRVDGLEYGMVRDFQSLINEIKGTQN